jgi:SM-20-related protein
LYRAAIAADLATRGWSCCDDFLTVDCVAALRAEAFALRQRGEFRAAAVGAGAGRTVRPEIRGDEISWLEPPFAHSLARLSEDLEQLRLALNGELTLGLFDLEFHFARYGPGRGYARHLDQLAGHEARVLSWVLYLNDEWRAEEGGALRLYMSQRARAPFLEFPPRGGRLMMFLSERFEHEVLPATRERLSIAGWFRRREGSWTPH